MCVILSFHWIVNFWSRSYSLSLPWSRITYNSYKHPVDICEIKLIETTQSENVSSFYKVLFDSYHRLERFLNLWPCENVVMTFTREKLRFIVAQDLTQVHNVMEAQNYKLQFCPIPLLGKRKVTNTPSFYYWIPCNPLWNRSQPQECLLFSVFCKSLTFSVVYE